MRGSLPASATMLGPYVELAPPRRRQEKAATEPGSTELAASVAKDKRLHPGPPANQYSSDEHQALWRDRIDRCGRRTG